MMSKKNRFLTLIVSLLSMGALAVVVAGMNGPANGSANDQNGASRTALTAGATAGLKEFVGDGDMAGHNRPLPVSVIRLGDIVAPVRTDDYRGTIQPSKEAELTFVRSGKIEQVLVSEGETVIQGAVLARLDVSDLQALVEATEARIAEAEATLAELVAGPRKQTIAAAEAEVRRLEAAAKLSQITTEREALLQRSRASSVQAYDDARFSSEQQIAALESARQNLAELVAGTRKERIDAQQARVDILKAELKGYEVDMRDSCIEAPFDGVVARRYVDEGIVAGPERAVLRVIQVDPLEARFGVSPEDARRLTKGQEMRITVGDTTVMGTVTHIEPEVDLKTRTQSVMIAIPRGERSESRSEPTTVSVTTGVSVAAGTDGIVPGRTASLSLEGQSTLESGSYWVPITSLSRSTRGLWSLFVVTEDPQGNARIARRDVLVQETDTEFARVAGTMVAEGDRVVADGLHRLTPGLMVIPTSVGLHREL